MDQTIIVFLILSIIFVFVPFVSFIHYVGFHSYYKHRFSTYKNNVSFRMHWLWLCLVTSLVIYRKHLHTDASYASYILNRVTYVSLFTLSQEPSFRGEPSKTGLFVIVCKLLKHKLPLPIAHKLMYLHELGCWEQQIDWANRHLTTQ